MNIRAYHLLPLDWSICVLRGSADQPCKTLQHLFNLSLSQEKVQTMWKTSWVDLLPINIISSCP